MMLQDIVSNTQETSAPVAPPSSCFACSPNHPRGLRLQFHANEKSEMIADWIPESDLEGYQGVIHGGIVSTVLDEAMAKVVSASGMKGVTGELRVRFRLPVNSGKKVCIRGWIERKSRLMVKTEASVTAADGRELAHGWATFLPMK